MDKKPPEPKKKDRQWQEKITKNLAKEKVQLDNPQGKERLQTVLTRILKKK